MWALVNNSSAKGSAASVTTTGVDTTGATFLVVSCEGFFTGAFTVTDFYSNVWVPLTAQNNAGVAFQQMFYCANPVVGVGHTFTVSLPATDAAIFMLAFSGGSATPFDVENGSDSLSATYQPGAVLPSNPDSLIVAACSNINGGFGGTFVNIDSGFTEVESQASTGGGMAYLIQVGAAASVNPEWTWSQSNREANSIAVFTVGTPTPITIPVPVATLAFTTYAPTTGTTILIEVPTATLSFTKYAPVVGRNIPVPAGSLTTTTYAPQLGYVSIEVPTRAMAFSTYAPVATEPTIIPVPKATLALTTYAPRVIHADLTPCAQRFGPKIYFWEPSYLDRPEDTFLRATDWENGGYQGLKFVQGIIIEADTMGITQQLKLQGDQGDIETISINHDGQIMKPYSLNQPVQKHLLRLLPLDPTVAWRLFNFRWVYEPAPEFAREWKTQGTTHDIPEFQFLKDGYIAHASTADITMNVTVDDVVFTYVIPHSSGEFIKTYMIFGIKDPSGRTTKGKLFTYELTSVNPFQLFEKDCEVRVHAWHGGDYEVKKPFGDISRVYGARI